MGGKQSRNTTSAAVRLECPQSHSSRGGFFAQLHTAAEGSCRYEVWGQPQVISLLPDDVITVSIFTAQSEQHYDKLLYDEFAEIYLPWETISGKVKQAKEEVFVLGMQPGTRWLRFGGQPSEYQAAFSSACRRVRENPSAPCLRVGIRLVAQTSMPLVSCAGCAGSEGRGIEQSSGAKSSETSMFAASQPPASASSSSSSKPPGSESAAVTSSIQELSPEEMKRLFQLQLKNKELRTHLNLHASSGPEVEEQVKEHLSQLRQAVAQNFALRAALQQEDKQGAELRGGLTPEQHLALTTAAVPGSQSGQQLSAAEEQEHEKAAAVLMSEIQAVTNENIELIATYDQQIKVLEAELGAAARQRQKAVEAAQALAEERLTEAEQRLRVQLEDLEVLEGDAAELESLLEGHATRREDTGGASQQQLQLELEVQDEQIGHLEQLLQRQEAEGAPLPPSTGILQDEVSMLQVEHEQEEQRTAEEREVLERQSEELRRETQLLKEELQLVFQAKLETEQCLRELRTRTQGSPSVRDRELEKVDEEVLMESLNKELSRCRRRIEFYDEKIDCLREEADDIRQRASQALRATLVGPGEESEGLAQQEEVVRMKEEEVAFLRKQEDVLRKEREEAKRAHEAAFSIVSPTHDRLEFVSTGSDAN